ncbi:MAG: thermonuclease family protein [Anaerolineae bacterium]|nr:thermonuclease family protein [Anaerolineae bacterium]
MISTNRWRPLAALTLLSVALLTLACSGVGAFLTQAPPTVTPQPGPTPHRTPARVVRVVDGDTIEVEIDGREYRVRYIGVDAPETVKENTPVEWMGPEASAANKALVYGKTVYLEKDVSETDRYGRLLRYLFLADGTFVNGELVRQGYAQAITYPPDVKYQELLRALEREAQSAGRGLWQPTPDDQ